MNKQEFLKVLEQSLAISAEEKDEVMLYYTEYFEDAGPENEQAVLDELGDPAVLAAKLNTECEGDCVEPLEGAEKNESAEADYGPEMEREGGHSEWERESRGMEREMREMEKEIRRNAENIRREALKQAEAATRSIYTSLRDILGGGHSEKEIRQVIDLDMEPFHTIRADVENCPITVAPSEDDNYGVDVKFALSDQDECEIEVYDGTLTIKKQVARHFHWGISGNSGRNSEHVRIYLPKVAMDIIELITSNASVQVDGVCAQTLIADTSNARIQIENTKVLDELNADTSNGAINLLNVEGEDVTLDTSNGAVTMERVTGRKANVDTSNGAIRAKFCEFEERLHADTSNGSIEVLLYGSEHEYHLHADTSNAKIYVDGQVRGSEYNTHGGNKDVWLDTSNGRITVGFVSRS